MSSVVLISTAEFALKSQPVRQQLVRLLKRHIRFNLKRIGQDRYRLTSAGGFIVVDVPDSTESAAKNLARVLGVSHADACERVPPSLDEIVESSAKLAVREIKQGETFAVRARRFEPSKLERTEIEIRAGSEILSRLSQGVKVDLTNPARTIRVFYGAKDAYVSAARYDGPSGLPVGSQGSLLGLATDPERSPLAFYLIMKRGAAVWPVIADLPLPIGGVPLDSIVQGLKRVRPFVPRNRYSARLVSLDQNTRQSLASLRPDVQRVFCTRLLVRAVKHFSRTTLGLVTSDRLGQGDVQSLKDLRAVDEIATFPIYRPLLALDEAYVRRHTEQLGLPQLETDKTPTRPSPSPYEDLIEEVNTLENRLKVERLAENLAAEARKIEIDFP